MITRYRIVFSWLLLMAAAVFLAPAASAVTLATGLAGSGDSAVCSYRSGLLRWGYASARVSYPCGLRGQAPAITLTGGYTNIKEQMYWLSDHLTSHGYIVITITPYNIFGTPPVWETAHKAGLAELHDENRRWFGPLRGRVDFERIAMVGYSMGCGGAMLASADVGNEVRAVVGLSPFLDRVEPNSGAISARTLLIGGSFDFVALPSAVNRFYQQLNADLPRGQAILRGLNHLDWIGFPSSIKNRAKTLVTAWLNLQLGDDASMESWFDGAEHDRHLAEDWFTFYDYQP